MLPMLEYNRDSYQHSEMSLEAGFVKGPVAIL